MKKYILTLLLCLCTAVCSWAQSSMTDNQVLEYVVREQKKGTSNAQIVTQLMQQGVTVTQIQRVRKMALRMKEESEALGVSDGKAKTDDRSRRNNGKLSRNAEEVADETRRHYSDEQKAAQNQSSMRRRRDDANRDYTYDAYNGDFIEMQDELNEWMPGDTATMYENLLRQVQYEKTRKQVFGRDVFSNETLTFEPNMNIATPANYLLGPGDAVFIDIYGATQKNHQATVSPDGFINIDGYGPVEVIGLTVEKANAKLQTLLGERYSDSTIKLTVGQTRSILVNVMGEVKNPGTYTLSAFSTVFNALYMAGGINDLGTLRSIKVYRDNALISTVDVYDFILNGKATGNVKLTDNDVIVVGAYDCLVNISGKVKRPMYYELKSNESLQQLLHYSGGFAGDAYTQSVRVIRKTGRQYSIHNVNEFDIANFTIADGDSVSVDSVIARFENMVQIKGAVFRPGMYQVGGNIHSVRTLIEQAAGLTEEAFTNRAVMHRMKQDRTLEVIAVDVDGIMNGKVPDVALQNEDVLFIPTKQDVQEDRTITIHGEVQYPGTYKYADNETLEDFVLQAGGLKESASVVKVDVSRRIINPHATSVDSLIAKNYTFALKDGFVVDGEPGFVLAPFDEVYVRRSPGYSEQQNITVKGEVTFPGDYTLPVRYARLSDAVRLAGGTNKGAYIPGARLERKTNSDERARMMSALKMAREQQQKNMLELATRAGGNSLSQITQQNENTALQKFQVPDYYPIGIELDKALANPGSESDIVLREGDRLIIPEYNGTVKINGAVMHANTVGYVDGKNVKYYIEQAGGFASDARKGNVYILYANGTVAKATRSAVVRPGCEIVVPNRIHSKMSVAEIMSLGSGATSIAALIASMANLLSK